MSTTPITAPMDRAHLTLSWESTARRAAQRLGLVAPSLELVAADESNALLVEMLAEQAQSIAELRAVATAQVQHLHLGQCPDRLKRPDARDPECPACCALNAGR